MDKIVYRGVIFNNPDFDDPKVFRNKTARAILKKILKRKPCEICGDLEVHAHHEIYSEYLNVRWLCPIHHKKIHSLFNHINATEKNINIVLNMPKTDFIESLLRNELKEMSYLGSKYGINPIHNEETETL